MSDPDERTNLLWGLGLFGLFLVLLGLTVAIAYIYLALDWRPGAGPKPPTRRRRPERPCRLCPAWPS